MTVLRFWIPVLPLRALAANGGGRSRRNPWEVAEAKTVLGDAAYHALREQHGPQVPHLRIPVTITISAHICYLKRPRDGCYRPTDPSNLGGDVGKPIVDYGLVKNEVIPDDTYKEVSVFATHIEAVETLAEEGIEVRVAEVES